MNVNSVLVLFGEMPKRVAQPITETFEELLWFLEQQIGKHHVIAAEVLQANFCCLFLAHEQEKGENY